VVSGYGPSDDRAGEEDGADDEALLCHSGTLHPSPRARKNFALDSQLES
jgi:hypothetical protein